MIKRIMFVCLGNICRSPAAEAAFLHIMERHGAKDRYQTGSSGTAAYHVGEPADERMRQAAEARGIHIAHRGLQLTRAHLKQFDLILCMDKENLADTCALTTDPLELAKIKLLRDFDPQGRGDVPDPYYSGSDGFETVLDIVIRSGESLFQYLENAPVIGRFQSISDAICALFGESVVEVSRTPISGGCINDAAVLHLSNSERLFIKENTAALTDMFVAEAEGLQALFVASRSFGGPIVPKPLAVGAAEGRQFILMEYIPPGRPGPRYAEDFGRALARIHLDRTESRFGFSSNNYIGRTVQINTWSSSWVSFFGEHRLGFQIQLATKRGLVSAESADNVGRLIERLGEYIPDDAPPSILHGDLWSGNAMANQNGSAVIIDPATYFGHNESDLAMTELFGRFSDRFYAAYSEVVPISPEYEIRKIIYGLYHILNHVNLFGTGYAAQAAAMVKQVI